MLLTQSAKTSFHSCRRRAFYRYERGLVPNTEAPELRFGDLVHQGLEAHFKGENPAKAIAYAASGPHERVHATAILAGYLARYPRDTFKPVAIEQTFNVPLLDGVDMRGGGKWDGLVRRPDGSLWVLEHKTASRIDAAYLERLWVDFQIAWYSVAAEMVYNEPVVGIIYDIIEKIPRADQAKREPETDVEWEQRRADAKAPNRLKRRMGETLNEYAERIHAAYRNPARFHREEILLDRTDIKLAMREMTDTAFDWIATRANGRWTRNTSQCFSWGRACSYLPICQSRENPLLIEARYRVEDPNRELAADAAPTDLSF